MGYLKESIMMLIFFKEMKMVLQQITASRAFTNFGMG